ncbi:MAG: hypothetical protein AAF960_29725 [Bacteroidota bacterium]
MKLVTYLLIITISCLAFKPALDAMGLGENCCTTQSYLVVDMDKDNNTDEPKDCGDNNCNPFQACCANVLLIAESAFVPFKNVPTVTKQPFYFQLSYIFSPTADFWHPPQLLV